MEGDLGGLCAVFDAQRFCGASPKNGVPQKNFGTHLTSRQIFHILKPNCVLYNENDTTDTEP